jgi:hypothetical protein
MSQFYGTAHNMPNLHAPWLIPEEFRVRHQLMIRVFDTKFKPFFSNILPAEESVGSDGARGVEKFDWPVMTSSRPMARLYGRDEPTEYINAGGIKTEHFNTIITKLGFQRRYDEFSHDFTNNLISKKYQILAEQIVEGVNKRIEFECGNVLYHNTESIYQFASNQIDMARGLTADIKQGKFLQYDNSTEISDLSSLLSGTNWSDTTSDPLRDLAAIQRAHEDMKGKSLTKAFLGPESIMWLTINDSLKDLLKYVKTLNDGVLGAVSTVMNVQMFKVIGNDLKEGTFYSGNASPPFGYPGLGDLDYDKWSDRNKVPLMVDGGTMGREWGIMAEDTVGNTFHSYINTKHQAQVASATVPYTKAKEEDDPDIRKIRIEKAFAPVVGDWADYVLLLNTVNRGSR